MRSVAVQDLDGKPAACRVARAPSRNSARSSSRARSAGLPGIETLDFGPAASQEFLKKANDVAWDSVIAKSPENGKKLRALAGN